MADVDGDGHADLVIGNYFADGDAVLDGNSDNPVAMQRSMSRVTNGGTDRILLWTPGGRFREARGARALKACSSSSSGNNGRVYLSFGNSGGRSRHAHR